MNYLHLTIHCEGNTGSTTFKAPLHVGNTCRIDLRNASVGVAQKDLGTRSRTIR